MSRAEIPSASLDDTDHVNSETSRIARISKGQEGDILGLPIFLTPSEVTRLGVDVEDCHAVEYSVQDGSLNLKPLSTGMSE